MEKKYPIGTEVETRFSGMVVGYNPPNYYRILKLNHFREEEFHENNITVPPGIASLHSVPPSLPETIEDCKPPPIKLEEEQLATVDHHNSMPCRTDRTRPIKQEELLNNDIHTQGETEQLSPSVRSVPLFVPEENVESKPPRIEENNLPPTEHNWKSNRNDMDHTKKQEDMSENESHQQNDEFAPTNPYNATEHVIKEEQALLHVDRHVRIDEIVDTCQQQQKPDRVRSRHVDGCDNDDEEHHRPMKKQAVPIKPKHISEESEPADIERNGRRSSSIKVIGNVAIKQE